MRALAILLLLIPTLRGQVITGGLSATPPLSPQAVAEMEARLHVNPADADSRLRLLAHYRDFSNNDPVRRAARLTHILYLIEHYPFLAQNSASSVLYVPRTAGPYANAADHDRVRQLWLRQVEAQPLLLLPTVEFLFMEDKEQAEELLTHAVANEPSNHRLAANLGFLYAMDVLGLDSLNGEVRLAVPEPDRARRAERARSALEQSTHAVVLAGAATTLPNLNVRAPGTVPDAFEFAAKLMAKARALEPANSELQGPMPMIRYFEEAQRIEPAKSPLPSRIRVSNVRAAKLIHSPTPVYPELAKNAGITGDVRLNAIIGRDGKLLNLTVNSGDPLLIPAALEAARQYIYEPTILNGAPVEVVTQIVIIFPPK